MFPSLRPSLTSLLHRLRPLVSSSHFSENDLKKIERIVEELKEVQKIWERIDAVLADAEERQIREESVHLWLRDLRDLADQIEHLRDVYEYEVVARDVEASKATSSSHVEVRPSHITSLSPLVDASFREQIDTDIRRIKEAFNSIASRREALHLKQAEADNCKYSFTDDVTKRETTSHRFREQIDTYIRRIKKAFNSIARRREALPLKQAEADNRKYSFTDDVTKRETTSQRVVDLVFLGRDRELQQVRDLLIGDGHRNVEVIVVVGMGGIGKTTLAQHVCKDPQVVGNFDRIGWVHVAENFDVIRLTKAAVKTFSGDSSPNELSSLQDEVVGLIKDKKVLLVMDDVWYTDNWESFLAPFDHGARKGSKILVTTRLPEVAIGVRAVDSIKLSSLSEEDGWSLLKRHAFPNQSNDVDILEELEEIGKRIVEKCGRLPLSIKLLGSLLCTKGNDEEWKKVSESNLLEHGVTENAQILGSLYLSYLYLPPKLKSCFKHCAIYPNGRIRTKRLTCSWMAYDVVNNGKEATKCLEELVSRSFINIASDDTGRSGWIDMHDHVYDLAQFVLGEKCRHLVYDGAFPEQLTQVDFSGSRHVSLLIENIPSDINITPSNLRTLKLYQYNTMVNVQISPGQCLRDLDIRVSSVKLTSRDGCQSPFKSLRILILRECESIPQECFQLYNLRYLDLSESYNKQLLDHFCDFVNLRCINIENFKAKCLPQSISRLTNLQELNLSISRIPYLPESISGLVNLQELYLYFCRNLKELPEGITNLTNLRILDLSSTSISFMPKGFGALTMLECLKSYVVKSAQAGLAELKNMKYLKDVYIENICEVVSAEDAEQAEMASKKCLRRMILCWRKYANQGCLNRTEFSDIFYAFSASNYHNPDMRAHRIRFRRTDRVKFPLERGNEEKIAHQEERVLELLRPHRNIENVFIFDYRGLKLQSWMGDKSFTKLVALLLFEINYCTSLSPVDQLPSLDVLILDCMDRLKELIPNPSTGHVDMDTLHPAIEQQQSFPKLKRLYIYHCRSLEVLPLSSITYLRYVKVHRCLNLQRMEPSFDTACPLKIIHIEGCPKFPYHGTSYFPNRSWNLNVDEYNNDWDCNKWYDREDEDDRATTMPVMAGFGRGGSHGSHRSNRPSSSDTPSSSRQPTPDVAPDSQSDEVRRVIAYYESLGYPPPPFYVGGYGEPSTSAAPTGFPVQVPIPARTSMGSDSPSSGRPSTSVPLPTVVGQTSASHPLLEVTADGRDFLNSNRVAKEITNIIKTHLTSMQFRWCRIPAAEQERLFDMFLSRFRLGTGMGKEVYRRAFIRLAEKRMSDTFFKARRDSHAKTGCEEMNFEEMKRFPPSWCTEDRWADFCDAFVADDEFGRRSSAGKTNRQKQRIKSTSGSKSHNQIRAEMAARLEREPSFQEWWSRSHMSGREGESQWSTPEAGQLLDRYLALSADKWGVDPTGEQPPFDKTIWKQVLEERDVVANRKQTLGGLPPYYVEEHRHSYSAYSQPSYTHPHTSQSSVPMESQMAMMVEQVTKLREEFTAYMSQGRASQPEEIESDHEEEEENDPEEEARMYARFKEKEKEKKKSKQGLVSKFFRSKKK